MQEKKRKLPIFYIIYIIVMVAVVATIGIGSWRLWVYFDGYEASLPKYVAQDVLKEYYSPCDFKNLFEITNVELNEYESVEHFVKYMENKTAGKDITYYEVSAGLGDIKKYVVKAGDEKFSDFTLKKSEKINEDGFEAWELDTINLVYSTDQKITFSLIKGGSAKLNGKELDLSKCTLVEDNIPTFSHGHMFKGSTSEPITYATYSIEGFLFVPELETFDRNGNKSVLALDEKSGIYQEEINYDNDLREKKLKIATEAAEVYICYISNDAKLALLKHYFDTDSEIYKSVMNTDTRWVAYHEGYEFKDESVSEFFAYSDDTFSCRYVCTHIMKGTPVGDAAFPIDITFYFREVGEDTLIYDFVSNN